MPGHAGSPYWATVDFDSEGDDVPTPPPSHRVYLDPWDNQAHGIVAPERAESSQENNSFNSFAGEPVSASFYYVPTKNYDSGEEPPLPPPRRKMSPRENLPTDDYSLYGRKLSRVIVPDVPDHVIYGEMPMRDRRRSVYIEEPIYVPHPMAPMMYEPMYGAVPLPPPPGCLPPRPRTRMSLPHQPVTNMMTGIGYGKSRRHSRLTDAYEHFAAYESLSPEYEDWARPFPKTAPDNFHLSRYGHLQIDYSFSWNSLDRLIRNQ